MFDFSQKEIKEISFYYLSKESNMIIRSEIAKTLPGTHSYHNFTPISNSKIETKVVCEQLEYSFVFNFQLMRLLKNACL